MYSPPLYSASELEILSESVNKLIDLENESKREEYWSKTLAEVYQSIENKPHYKYSINGEISVFGNACTIKETEPELSEEQRTKKELLRIGKRKRTPDRKKGDIKSFSKNSRLRMMKKTNRVDFKEGQIAYFLTLTYPDPFPTDGKIYKADLDLIIKRIKKQFGTLSYLWKLESQMKNRDGAPHYHLIIFFEKRYNIDFVKQWISQNWFEVVQRNWSVKNYDHFKVGTNTKIVKTLRQLTNYVTKYITKKEGNDKLINQGRYWGCSRNWGTQIIDSIPLTGKQLIIFKRLMKSYLKKSNKRMARKMTHCRNIEIWAHWKFILNALNWTCTMH